jgi:NAD(P)-dependent dehydrogenase (short-subunit alcohol dehydrogenase family)
MKTIVMTGANSGLGKLAAERLLARGHNLIVGARNTGAPDAARILPLDLGDLNSVRAFAKAIGDTPIDALILNAGMQSMNIDGRTAQGFEQTFGVNHLAHFLLVNLLLPNVREGGTIVLTSSGTHDPADKTGVPPPRHANARWLAFPDQDPELDKKSTTAGMRAYSSSKLANLMTARSLALHTSVKARGIHVYAYCPGFVPSTGLSRAAPVFVRAVVYPALALMRPFMAGMNTIDNAGYGLADLADGTLQSDTEIYCAMRAGRSTWQKPSPLARNDALCAELWADSATMVGLNAAA